MATERPTEGYTPAAYSEGIRQRNKAVESGELGPTVTWERDSTGYHPAPTEDEDPATDPSVAVGDFVDTPEGRGEVMAVSDEGVREAGSGMADDFVSGHPSVGDYLAGDGIVVDPAQAREYGCYGYRFPKKDGETGELVYARHGVVGALSQDQKETFCSDIDFRALTPAQEERLAAFDEANTICDAQVAGLPKGEEQVPYLACLSTALSERGQPF